MKKLLILILAMLFVVGTGQVVIAATMDISVAYDVSLGNGPYYSDTNLEGNASYIYVGDNTGDRDFQGMFGFDVSALTGLVGPGDSLTVNSITFNAYNNYTNGDGDVHIALGNTDDWDRYAVTWNNSQGNHGAILDSEYIDGSDLYNYVAWDVSAIGTEPLIDNDFVTFYLYITIGEASYNWHDFEPEESSNSNEAFLHIDYDITSAPIPEPATMLLLGSGLIGLAGTRRKFKK